MVEREKSQKILNFWINYTLWWLEKSSGKMHFWNYEVRNHFFFFVNFNKSYSDRLLMVWKDLMNKLAGS